MRLGSSERENALLFAERGIYRPGDTFASKASSAVRRKPETSLVGRKLTPRAHDLYTAAPLDIPGSQSDSGAEATVSM